MTRFSFTSKINQTISLFLLLPTAMLTSGCENTSEPLPTNGKEFARKAKLLAECRLSGSTSCNEKLDNGTLMTVESYTWGKQNGYSVSTTLKGEAECKNFTHHALDRHLGVILNQTHVKNIGSEMHYAFADKICEDGSASFTATISLVHLYL